MKTSWNRIIKNQIYTVKLWLSELQLSEIPGLLETTCRKYGKKTSADEGAVDVFKTEFKDLVKKYTKDQIFNTHETSLNFKML